MYKDTAFCVFAITFCEFICIYGVLLIFFNTMYGV